MVRSALAGVALGLVLNGTAALAQATPPLPTMPRPPSFEDATPAQAKAKKPRKAKQASDAQATGSGASSYERPNKFVPAEFDRERSGGSGAGARPVMTEGGRPGMGMRF
jgi:hypothetical protein